MGEFDADGNLLGPGTDPLLYWVVPILREPRRARASYVLKDYVAVHAGSEPPFVPGRP